MQLKDKLVALNVSLAIKVNNNLKIKLIFKQ